ncbi:MAG TPA: hypothetical protein PKK31_10110, partial [Elusimicrobiales bacterium]|nr:hypothetical protein [Elusimicrobiales bacterium]
MQMKMKRKPTAQEKFWAGDFGKEYSRRNTGARILAGNTVLFSRILSRTNGVRSVIEFGANIGLNLAAIRSVLPGAELSAVEINPFAAEALKKNLPQVRVYRKSLLDFKCDKKRDLALIKGVLIHQAPDLLPRAYEVLYRSSDRYICVAEYYSPVPVQVEYRGHSDRLFKRDFAGEMMARYKDLRLV